MSVNFQKHQGLLKWKCQVGGCYQRGVAVNPLSRLFYFGTYRWRYKRWSVTHICLLLVRTCFISPHNRAVQWKAWKDSAESSVTKPNLYQETFIFPLDKLGNERPIQVASDIRELAVECLFSGDNDQITITTLILRSILLAPIDIRRYLISLTLHVNLLISRHAIPWSFCINFWAFCT